MSDCELNSIPPQDGTANIPKHLVASTPISDVLSVDYRLSHLNPFPAALIDAISGYVYLINNRSIDPKRIVVVGDSAGGNLALA